VNCRWLMILFPLQLVSLTVLDLRGSG
jgi:hypothetical protein